MRKTFSADTRVCPTCKQTKWPGIDVSGVTTVLHPSETSMQSAPATPVDTTVVVMDGAGQVIERVPAVEFAKRQGTGQHRSRFNGPVRPLSGRSLEGLSAEAVATFTTYQRQYYRDRFRDAGLPVPEALAPRKSGPRPVAA